MSLRRSRPPSDPLPGSSRRPCPAPHRSPQPAPVRSPRRADRAGGGHRCRREYLQHCGQRHQPKSERPHGFRRCCRDRCGFYWRTYTIKNNGPGTLTVSGISRSAVVIGTPPFAITLAGNTDFTVLPPTLTPIPEGGTLSFQVKFDPSATGSRATKITVNSNADGAENVYEFRVAGNVAREIAVTDSSLVVIPDNNTIPIPEPATGSNTDLGTVTLGSSSSPRTFRIANTSTDLVSVLYLTGSPKVSITGDALDFTVEQPVADSLGTAGSTTFKITFTHKLKVCGRLLSALPAAISTKIPTRLPSRGSQCRSPISPCSARVC